MTFEAQAAIELEAAARTVPRDGGAALPDELGRRSPGTATSPSSTRRRCSPRSLADRDAGVPPPVLAAGFHEAIGTAAPRWPRRWRPSTASTRSSSPAACSRTSGSARSSSRRCAAGVLDVLVHEQIPANDGGISIGQAAIAAWRTTLVARWLVDGHRAASERRRSGSRAGGVENAPIVGSARRG